MNVQNKYFNENSLLNIFEEIKKETSHSKNVVAKFFFIFSMIKVKSLFPDFPLTIFALSHW